MFEDLNTQEREGAYASGLYDNGLEWVVYPMIYTARLCVGPPEDRTGYDDAWCYGSLEAALAAARAWDGKGDPEGWHRHPASGRRRPGGDPKLEFIRA